MIKSIENIVRYYIIDYYIIERKTLFLISWGGESNSLSKTILKKWFKEKDKKKLLKNDLKKNEEKSYPN